MNPNADTRPIEVGRISAVMAEIIAAGKPVMTLDRTTDRPVAVLPEIAAAPDGFLPLLLAAGDTVWREVSGRSLGLDLQRDPDTLLGFRGARIAPGPTAPVLLSTLHAMIEAERPDMLLLNDLQGPWRAAQERLRWRQEVAAPVLSAAPAPGAPLPVPPARGPQP